MSPYNDSIVSNLQLHLTRNMHCSMIQPLQGWSSATSHHQQYSSAQKRMPGCVMGRQCSFSCRHSKPHICPISSDARQDFMASTVLLTSPDSAAVTCASDSSFADSASMLLTSSDSAASSCNESMHWGCWYVVINLLHLVTNLMCCTRALAQGSMLHDGCTSQEKMSGSVVACHDTAHIIHAFEVATSTLAQERYRHTFAG